MSLRRWMLGVGLLAFAAALVALPARATYGARTTADEPQYLLSALSIWEDGNLDIADELAAQRWRDFHEGRLPTQTEPLADGREVSPHDPLLPLLLAAPVGLAGWAGAKAALAVVAGLTAALVVWTAHRRFAVPLPAAGLVAGALAVSPPLVSYGSQVYPELPAGLALLAAVAAATGPLDRRGRLALLVAVVALPWLAVKYAPAAAAVAAVGLVRLAKRGDRADALGLAATLGAAGVAFLAAHHALYGGWTVYAAGDHFQDRGELSVAGFQPDLLGRSRRLLGLFVDRGFGLAAWAPAWLLLVPAVAGLARRRPAGWTALVAPLAAGWATATWVALTMHGWWWPGRQVVVVLPLAAVVVAWWAGVVAPRFVPVAVALGAVGAAAWAWLVVEVLALRLRLIIDFESTSNPLVRAWRLALPELRHPGAADWLRYGAWLLAAALAARAAWRHADPERLPLPTRPLERNLIHVPA